MRERERETERERMRRREIKRGGERNRGRESGCMCIVCDLMDTVLGFVKEDTFVWAENQVCV